jgi:hypothetical protein
MTLRYCPAAAAEFFSGPARSIFSDKRLFYMLKSVKYFLRKPDHTDTKDKRLIFKCVNTTPKHIFFLSIQKDDLAMYWQHGHCLYLLVD